MVDVRIKEGSFNFFDSIWDWTLRADTSMLDEREELATSVRVALGTDSLADADVILPDPDNTDRRGWWGDLDAKSIWQGWPIGCQNWVLTRSKITEAPDEEGDTLERARLYTLAALQPFIDHGVCTHVEVDARRTDVNRIDVRAKIYRGPLLEIDLQYQPLWTESDIPPDPQPKPPFLPVDLNVKSPVLALGVMNGKVGFVGATLTVQPYVLGVPVKGG